MITLIELKAHLNVTHALDDTILDIYRIAAEKKVEEDTRRAINQRTETYIIDGFPNEFTLPVAPVQSITTLKHNDADDVEQTLVEGTDFLFDNRELKGILRPVYGTTWPTTTMEIKSVTVVYVAGYTAGSEPEPLKLAALMIAASLYDQREDHVIGVSVVPVPVSAKFMMSGYVIKESYESG